jgi:hypothetical protein
MPRFASSGQAQSQSNPQPPEDRQMCSQKEELARLLAKWLDHKAGHPESEMRLTDLFSQENILDRSESNVIKLALMALVEDRKRRDG